MNHSVKLTDTFSFPAEAVSVGQKEYFGTKQTASCKAIFKVADGNYFKVFEVDFLGDKADLPQIIKPGRVYMVTIGLNGRESKGKVWMSMRGLGLGEL